MAYILAMRPANRIRELRKRAGMNQQELAHKAGVSQAAVSQLENDTRPLTLDWMRTFARVFGVAPVDIMGDDDNPDRLSDEERELLWRYRNADPVQREMISRVAEPPASYSSGERSAA